jgi:hypothetical protein
MPETEQRNINSTALPDFHTSSGDNVLFCPLPFVRVRSRGFPQMGGCYLLKYNGGDSGIKNSVLYWRCSLIRVSVIRGSTVSGFCDRLGLISSTLFGALLHHSQQEKYSVSDDGAEMY